MVNEKGCKVAAPLYQTLSYLTIASSPSIRTATRTEATVRPCQPLPEKRTYEDLEEPDSSHSLRLLLYQSRHRSVVSVD